MYKLFYHPKIKKEIFKLEKVNLLLFKKVVKEKISIKPIIVGKNLQGSLKNYRSLRFGKYRIIYKVTENTIFVIAIGLRKEVYEKAKKRLGMD
jgi:addiction module RelE/StbE family toxin